MTRPLVIYHASCADGFTAAWVARKHFKGEADFLAAHYGDPVPDVTGRDVYVLDFSWKRPEMMALIAAARSVVVLDHHKTAKDELDGLENISVVGHEDRKPIIVFDMAKSGAMLTWEYFHHLTEMPPSLIRLVQDRDLWAWKEPHSKEINTAIASYEKTFDEWDKLHYMLEKNDAYMSLLNEGRGILRYQGRLVENAVANCWETEIAGYKVKCVNVSEATLISEVAGRLAEGRPFGATFFVNARGERVFSLRSRDGGIDVSEVAKAFGGGGHRQASGFHCEPGKDISQPCASSTKTCSPSSDSPDAASCARSGAD